MSGKAYVSPFEETLAGQEENLRERGEMIDSWKVSGNYPANAKEFYQQGLELVSDYQEFIEELVKDNVYYRELARVRALQLENLRHITILAPVCGQKPPVQSPAATAQVMNKRPQNKRPQQPDADKSSGCCAIS